jgi:hypothetical protein
MEIALMYIKKHGGFPLNGGGLRAIAFKHDDVHFIAKIINELDMSDDNFYYALSIVQYHCNKDYEKRDYSKDTSIRIKMMKKLMRDLEKTKLNKSITYQAEYIYINQLNVK